MVEIRNLKFQPLALHLADSRRAVHLAPRGRAEVRDADVSDEIRNAAARGFVALRGLKPAKQAKPAAPKAPAPAQAGRPKAADKDAKKTGGEKA